MGEGLTTKKHKENNRKAVCAVITLSDSRTINEDESGKLIKTLLEKEGHKVIEHKVIPDDKRKLALELLGITARVNNKVDIIITNGGTGLSSRDVTPETVEPLFTKKISSFSTLFSMISFNDVGSTALVSRATAGIINSTAVFCMPGSPKAVKLGMEKLILPEISHIIKHLGD